MIRWEFIILVLAVLQLLWVLTKALRNSEEMRRQSSGGNSDARTIPARTRQPTDVDLFLEKINQRRREAAARQAQGGVRIEPASPVRSTPARPDTPRQPSDRSVTVVVPYTAQAPSVRRPSRPARPADKAAALPEVIAVESVEVKVSGPGSTAAALDAAPAAPATSIVVVRKAGPDRGKINGLLHSQEGLRAAFLLQEILGKPLSKRRPRMIAPVPAVEGSAAPPDSGSPPS
jgi:hypothetical protein